MNTKKLPRGRPRRLNPSDGVALAEPLFHRDGYDALAITEICDAIGVRQPALYRAYGSKAGLFEAALRLYAQGPYAAFVGEVLGRAETAEEGLRAVVLNAAALYGRDRSRPGCLVLSAVGAIDDEARRTATLVVEATRAGMVEAFAGLGAPAPEAFADAALTAMHGLSAEARAGRPADALTRAATALIDGIAGE